jgi:hypothetical protein
MPLAMTDVWTLNAMLESEPWSDGLRQLLDEARPVITAASSSKDAPPLREVWPFLHKYGSVYWAVFDVDFSKSESQLLKEFQEWLRLPEQRGHLQRERRPTTGATGGDLDRLKDLAAWRLFRELGNDWNAANEFANKKRKAFGDMSEVRTKANKEQVGKWGYKTKSPRPFHSARQQCKGRIPPHKADLFAELADAYKARASAASYMALLLPEAAQSLHLECLSVCNVLDKWTLKA